MIPVTQLLAPIPPAQMRATLTNLLVGLGVRADLWIAGGTASTIVTVMSNTLAGLSSLMSLALSANFLDYAAGSWLVLLAFYVYGVTAFPATFASGSLTLTNAGGGVYSYAPYAATFLNPTTHVTYTNTQAISLGAVSSQTFTIQATVAGSQGSSAPGQITSLVTSMLGVTASNALSIVGQDAETDPALRLRCQAALAAQSVRGPRGAYQWAVRTAINPNTLLPVNVNRIQVLVGAGGVISIYCASPSGTPTSDDLTAVAANVEAVARPNSATVNIYSTTTTADTDSITLWAQALPGLTAAGLVAAAEAAVTAFIAMYPIGGLATTGSGKLFASGIDGVIKGTNPAIYAVTGANDWAIASGQVITDGTIISAVLVPVS